MLRVFAVLLGCGGRVVFGALYSSVWLCGRCFSERFSSCLSAALSCRVGVPVLLHASEEEKNTSGKKKRKKEKNIKTNYCRYVGK